MIYANFGEENLVGGSYESVLRTIPYPRKQHHGDTLSQDFRNVHHLPLKASQIQDLQFEIGDDTGDLVHFEDGRTVIKAIFTRHT